MKYSFYTLFVTFLAKPEISSFQNVKEIEENSSNSSIDWTNIIVRATAPEGNLTQGEVVFSQNNSRFQSGFGVDVFVGLQISLGFKIEVVTAKGWATQFPNGSWFGMARQIIDDEADLSLAKTSILPYRANGLAYLVPTHGLGLYAFFVQPSSSTSRNIFLDPFSPSLWITFVATVFLLTFSLKILSHLQSHHSTDISLEDEQLMRDSGLWAFYAVSQHGYYSPPYLISLRIVLITGILFTLIVYVSYSAQLVVSVIIIVIC